MISTAVRVELDASRDAPLQCLAGGASGGDILFLEACQRLGIAGRLCLGLPREAFVAASVADSGGDWVARFDRLFESMPVEYLPDATPCDGAEDLNVWQRANLWMLERARELSGGNTTLIALWDGDGEDGPGGTRDMVRRAQAIGARFVHLHADNLLGDNDGRNID